MVGAGTDKTKPPLGGGPAVILVRPQLAVNIGMCARAMANFGLDDLRLVNPRAGWPRSDDYREVAYSAAAGATALLDGARLFDSVGAAVADCRRVYAATARERGQAKAVMTPSVAMAATSAAAGEKHAILFGPERTGLDNDEVAIADAIVTFPSNPAYASLNLAQAVLLCGYEWFKAAHGDAPPPSTIPRAVLAAGATGDVARFLRLSRGAARRERLLPARRPRSRGCGATCATSFTAWSSLSRTCARYGARSSASPRDRGSKSRPANASGRR